MEREVNIPTVTAALENNGPQILEPQQQVRREADDSFVDRSGLKKINYSQKKERLMRSASLDAVGVDAKFAETREPIGTHLLPLNGN